MVLVAMRQSNGSGHNLEIDLRLDGSLLTM
jgi:hypothetical protein